MGRTASGACAQGFPSEDSVRLPHEESLTQKLMESGHSASTCARSRMVTNLAIALIVFIITPEIREASVPQSRTRAPIGQQLNSGVLQGGNKDLEQQGEEIRLTPGSFRFLFCKK